MASLSPITGALGHRKAAHLIRRTSFRFNRKQVDELAGLDAAAALAKILAPAPFQHEQPLFAAKPGDTPQTWINPPQPAGAPLPADDADLKPFVMAWWLNEALHDAGITHKMMFFLHQYQAVSVESGNSMEFFDYLALLRWGSLGNFKKLVQKMILDNCMLTYLDNDQNFKNNPNENFAREFFELFTIGKGEPAGPGDYTNYTEEDIQEAARVFTGFNHAPRVSSIDPETKIPTGKAYAVTHDFTPKKFSPRFGGASIAPPTNDADGMYKELGAMVDLVFAHDETARFFCRRLYRYFVTRRITPEIEQDIINELANVFKTNNFEIKPVLEKLLQSQHFFDADDTSATDEIMGALIKSPLDLTLEALSFFEVPIPDAVKENQKHYLEFYNSAVIGRMLASAGMELFFPPDVAGYTGYFQEPDLNRQFFNSATIIPRYKLPKVLLTGTHAWLGSSTQSIGTKLDVVTWLRNNSGIADPSDSFILVKEMLQYLFPEQPDTDRFDYFHNTIFLDNLPPGDWTYEWQEYIKSGNDTEVRIPLERLVNAIMYAPEYQVF